ncbi:MAG: hypothetical protein AAFU53_06395 [Cyanobacteria bacterium J06632_3]
MALSISACGSNSPSAVSSEPTNADVGAVAPAVALDAVATPAAVPHATAAAAPTCNHNFPAGAAVGGQIITVDTCSVKAGNPRAIDFVYYLGAEKIESSADCPGGNWTTYPERAVHYPQSAATQTMVNIVCQKAGHAAVVAAAPVSQAPALRPAVASRQTDESIGDFIPSSHEWFVYDPPSNVRTVPGGDILCSIQDKRFIHVSGYISAGKEDGGSDIWRKTNACGSEGWIHGSQLQS